jgi:hypothetical protein
MGIFSSAAFSLFRQTVTQPQSENKFVNIDLIHNSEYPFCGWISMYAGVAAGRASSDRAQPRRKAGGFKI